MDEIKCSECGEYRASSEYVGYLGKLRKHCVACAERISAYAKANRERCREYNRAWKTKNRDRVKELSRANYEQNREVRRASGRKWYENNREKVKENNRIWCEQNRERVTARSRAYNLANFAKLQAYQRSYNEANRERVLEKRQTYRRTNSKAIVQKVREWRKSHPEVVKGYARNRYALHSGAEGKHTPADIDWLYEQQGGRCEACRKVLVRKGRGKFHVDHMQPLSRGGGNDVSNLQLLCPSCNTRKQAIPYEDWCSRLGRLTLLVDTVSQSAR